MHSISKILFFSFIIFPLPYIGVAQGGIRPGKCTTPLPYFDDSEDGFAVLRDGTKIEGNISIKNYDKEGRISITTASGGKYKLDIESLDTWGLNMNIPVCRSPLSYFEWDNVKRRENKEAERGFVLLTTGEMKDGKIKISGRSSDSPLAGENYFALETLTFVDKTGQKTEYKKDQIKEYGRILPWALSPPESYVWQLGEVMGKKRTKFQSGYVITNDGRRIEGNMQLVVINSMNSMPKAQKTKSNVVDEIRFQRDKKDEKIDMDDVFAYGLTGATINSITDNQNLYYNVEEMNFHTGSVTTKGGKKMDGLLAWFPEPGNYYGVYFATKFNEPVTIIAKNDIENITQDISLIEAFDDGTVAAKKTNTNINGYVISEDGKKYEGTVKLVDDKDFWCPSIEFTDPDYNVLKYGGTGKRLAYCVMNGSLYVQHGSFFMKAEKLSEPLALYHNPYPDTVSIMDKLISNAVATGSETPAVSNNFWTSIPRSNTPGKLNAGSLAYNIGASISEYKASSYSKKHPEPTAAPLPYKSKNGKDFYIINVNTGEIAKAVNNNWKLLLGGCMDYLNLEKDAQKEILFSDEGKIIDYLYVRFNKKK